MTTIVIGNSGQLARSLKLLNDKIVCLGSDDINIINYQDMIEVLNKYDIQGIINASAFTAVDKAESEVTQAFNLNETGVENLAKFASSKNLHFIHISTDYVFSGDKGSPYLVSDAHAPLGAYGESKAAGEKAILEYYPQKSCIIRTSWVYSAFGNNFVKTMLRLMNYKPQLSVVDDQIGSPTSASALAKICLSALELKVMGIHHFTDAGVCSWYDFALAIQELGIKYGLVSRAIPIDPIPTVDYPTPATRPSYSVLDKSSLKREFNGLKPNHWREELERVIKQLTEDKSRKENNQ